MKEREKERMSALTSQSARRKLQLPNTLIFMARKAKKKKSFNFFHKWVIGYYWKGKRAKQGCNKEKVYRLQNMEGNGNEQPKCQRSFAHRGRKNNCFELVVQILCMILDDNTIPNIQSWDKKKEKLEEALTQLEDIMMKNDLLETEVVKLLRIILGDESVSTTTSWALKVMKVVEAIEQLKDPQFGLKRLQEMMEESISQNTKIKEAFQLLTSVMKQSENSVPNQDYTDEIKGLVMIFEDL
ncbi:hypothetical protein J1N35_009067 [Gossypium stocksii]|uniref:Uncharacterized protein n=1 Tax=Gossypium stocksii TaxID=47602 RepID=A0A9D3W901_9ROSI|nr:hypothetical protein J1N35_009067 [Gossypium stocksii]